MRLDFCPRCFNEVNSGLCSKCGFDVEAYESHSKALKPGTIIAGKYKMGAVLGIGGFGITYTCLDLNNRKIYAIKEFMPNNLAIRCENGEITVDNEEDRDVYNKGLETFLMEANILVDLKDVSGIVDMVHLVYENKTGYLVMEYLDGVSLKSVLKNSGTVEPDFALKVIIEVANALKVAHSQGILHRDISPENIMILNDQRKSLEDRIRLIDFGAARYFSVEKNKDLSILLKRGFAPPEQYSLESPQGAYTDIYALAATYYKLVTGNTPPDARDSRAVHDTVERLDGKYLGVSKQVGEVMYKALSLDFRERYRNIDEFLYALCGNDNKKDESYKKEQPAIFGTPTEPQKEAHPGFMERLFGMGGKKQKPPKREKIPWNPATENRKSPFIRVTSGAIDIGKWTIPQDTEMCVGRDFNVCDLVVHGSLISRKHCTVRYNSEADKFIVVDYSSNGTYMYDGTRIERYVEYAFEPGSVVILASTDFIMEVGVK